MNNKNVYLSTCYIDVSPYKYGNRNIGTLISTKWASIGINVVYGILNLSLLDCKVVYTTPNDITIPRAPFYIILTLHCHFSVTRIDKP